MLILVFILLVTGHFQELKTAEDGCLLGSVLVVGRAIAQSTGRLGLRVPESGELFFELSLVSRFERMSFLFEKPMHVFVLSDIF